MFFAKYGLNQLLPGSVCGVISGIILIGLIVKGLCDHFFSDSTDGMALSLPVSEAGFTVELKAPSSWSRLFGPRKFCVSVLSSEGITVGQWATFEPENSAYLIQSMQWKSPTCLTFEAIASEIRVVMEQAEPRWHVTEITE